MADLLLYIKRDQVDSVFKKGDIGSGQTSFGGMSRTGGRVFVASKTERGLAVLGEIPIDEAYTDPEHPEGWKFRIRAVTRAPHRYRNPVMLNEAKGELDLLRDAANVWNAIRNSRRLTSSDAEFITRRGGTSNAER